LLMKRVVELGKFFGSKFDNGDECLTHLQYANDTLIIREKKWTNIQIIKASLLLFKIISNLKVNFHKCLLVKLNVPERRLEEAASILNCKLGSTPFKYLGVPIGANMRRKETWNSVIKAVRSRVSKWKNKQLFIGGCVVAIKLVFSVISVYFLSFFKAPAGIISKL